MQALTKQARQIGVPFVLGFMLHALLLPCDPGAVGPRREGAAAVRGARSTIKDRHPAQSRWLHVDVYRAPPGIIGSPDALEAALRAAARSRNLELGAAASGITLHFGTGRGFQTVLRGPDGYLTATSWPDAEVVLLDLWLFCEPDATLDDMDAHMAALVGGVGGAVAHSKWSAGRRGAEGVTDIEETTWTKHWFDRQRVAHVQSEFQKIEIWEFGPDNQAERLEGQGGGGGSDRPDHVVDFEAEGAYRTLSLDGVTQSSTTDERTYHESLVHPAMIAHPSGAKRVAILGGGEGGTLREVLKYSSVTEAVMVELDPGVVEACQKWLPSMSNCSWQKPGSAFFSCFDDPRTNFVPDDAFKWFKERFGADSCESDAEKFDVIILDLLDPEYLPDVPFAAQLYGPAFLRQLSCALTEDGVLTGQIGESPWPGRAAYDERIAKIKVPILHDLAANYIPHGTFIYDVYVPSFRGEWAFVLACKTPACASRFLADKVATDRSLHKRLDPRSQLGGIDANRLANDNDVRDELVNGLEWFDGSTLQKLQHTHRAWQDAYCKVAFAAAKHETGGSPFTECDPTAQSIPGSADTGAGRVGWKPYIARHVESKELIDGTNVGR